VVVAQSRHSGDYQAIHYTLYSEKRKTGKRFARLYMGAGQSNAQHLAVIESLKALKKPCKVKLLSDAQKFVTAFNDGSMEKWAKNGFSKPKKQAELYKQIYQLLSHHEMEIQHLKSNQRDTFGDDTLTKILQYKDARYIDGVEELYSLP